MAYGNLAESQTSSWLPGITRLDYLVLPM